LRGAGGVAAGQDGTLCALATFPARPYAHRVANVGEPGTSHPNVVPTWLRKLWCRHPRWVLAAGAVMAVALIFVVIVLITFWIAALDVGPGTGAHHAAALQSAREAVRTQLLTLGAGVFAAGALVYTARNFALSRGALEETRARSN
jgi:hypothetical protein